MLLFGAKVCPGDRSYKQVKFTGGLRRATFRSKRGLEHKNKCFAGEMEGAGQGQGWMEQVTGGNGAGFILGGEPAPSASEPAPDTQELAPNGLKPALLFP